MASENVELASTGLNATLGIAFGHVTCERVEAAMPITPAICQPFGFVHGGATIALLESVASQGALERCDLQRELPFGAEVSVRHRKSGRVGAVRGVAEFQREEPSRGRAGGTKQFWRVTAYDDEGDIMTEGTVLVRVVPKDGAR